MEYSINEEKFHENYNDLEPLYRAHYQEMTERLLSQGVEYAPYKPRLDQYNLASKGGWLITYVVRLDFKPVGYCNMYVTNDMHNGEIIAQEDAIFVLKQYRNGIGRKLVQFVLADLRNRNVKRLNVNAMTDLRATKLWERMGFKHTCHNMTYTF